MALAQMQQHTAHGSAYGAGHVSLSALTVTLPVLLPGISTSVHVICLLWQSKSVMIKVRQCHIDGAHADGESHRNSGLGWKLLAGRVISDINETDFTPTYETCPRVAVVTHS